MGESGLYLSGASRPDSCLQPWDVRIPFYPVTHLQMAAILLMCVVPVHILAWQIIAFATIEVIPVFIPILFNCFTAGEACYACSRWRATAEPLCRKIGAFAHYEDFVASLFMASEFQDLSAFEKTKTVQRMTLFARGCLVCFSVPGSLAWPGNKVLMSSVLAISICFP